MATRTCRIMGVAFGDPNNPVTATVDFAGERVFNGAVPTRLGSITLVPWDQHDVLCSWSTSIDLGDTVSVVLTFTNGSVTVAPLKMNNRNDLEILELDPDAVWPLYRPETVTELMNDYSNLAHSAFEQKYGFSGYQVHEHTISQGFIPAEDNFQPWPVSSHRNWKLNGEPMPDRRAPINPVTSLPYRGIPHINLDSEDTLSYDLLLSKDSFTLED